MTCSRCAPFKNKGTRLLWSDESSTGRASEPKCAFDEDGNWDDSNWDCQTLAILRGMVPWSEEFYSEDQTLLVIPFGGVFVVLGFYKHRGHVETGILVTERHHQPLNLALIEHLLAAEAER